MFNTIVLSGGGWNGLLAIGSLIHIFETCDINQISKYVGTSSGAFICYLLCIGYDLYEIITDLLNMKLYELLKKANAQNYIRLWQDQYLYDFGETVGRALGELTLKKLGFVPTLSQLYQSTNKTLVCHSYNMSTRQGVQISKDTHPHLSCIKAIQMSCSIPLFFDRCYHDGNLYIDGGIIDNFPLTPDLDVPSTLGIVIDHCPGSTEPSGSIPGYLWELFMIVHSKVQQMQGVNASKGACIVKLCTKKSGIGDIERESVIHTITEGYTMSTDANNRNFILV
tara:strand:+ start:1748 stop:2590 length:843 start_codon:yes stop_codon:yes gene_type:complete